MSFVKMPLFVTVFCAAMVMSMAARVPPPTYEVEEDDVACFILTAKISYKFGIDNTTVAGTFGEDVSVNGSCTNDSASILISTRNESTDIAIGMQFTSNGTEWYGTILNLMYGDADSEANVTFLSAMVGQQYACKPSQKVSVEGTFDGTVTISHIRLQPFDVQNSTLSSDVANCSNQLPTSNTVPIAVGAGLCVLVFVVIVSYLIGRHRHRHRASGYQAVDGETH